MREWVAPSGRAEQAGMFLAGATVPETFQRTLMPRGVVDQGLATGILMALEYTVGVLVQDTVEAAAAWSSSAHEHGYLPGDRTWRRHAMALDLAAITVGAALRKTFSQEQGENVARSWARLAGRFITNGAFSGLFAGAFQEAVDGLKLDRLRSFPLALPGGVLLGGAIGALRRERRGSKEPGFLSVPKELEAFTMSPLVAFALAGISAGERAFARSVSRSLARIFNGHERLLRPLGHAAAVAGIGYGLGRLVKLVYGRIEQIASRIEPAFNVQPRTALVSGGPGSLVPWDTLSKQGRRFVSTYLRTVWIERVMHEPAEAEPIRIFAAFDCAATEEERVELTLRELERTGAFERSLLMVISPTGTGYVNYVAVEAAEYLTLGDIASVALQYSKRPSVLSMDRVPDGVRQYRLFLEALHARLSKLEPEKRPRVVLFGESLGAWTSEDAFAGEGTDGMLALGVDRGLWIGTPHGTKWKDQVLGPSREDVDRLLVGAFNDFGQVEELPGEERRSLRYVMITHYNDAVAHFGLDLLVRRPEWLGEPGSRPATVPATEVYLPLVTFVLTLIDMKNAANVVPGRFEAKGHDYRKDLARFVREVYGLRCGDERLDRVEKALREYELAREEWIDVLDKPEKKKAGWNGRKKGKKTGDKNGMETGTKNDNRAGTKAGDRTGRKTGRARGEPGRRRRGLDVTG